jgi:hypothetical protein
LQTDKAIGLVSTHVALTAEFIMNADLLENKVAKSWRERIVLPLTVIAVLGFL